MTIEVIRLLRTAVRVAQHEGAFNLHEVQRCLTVLDEEEVTTVSRSRKLLRDAQIVERHPDAFPVDGQP